MMHMGEDAQGWWVKNSDVMRGAGEDVLRLTSGKEPFLDRVLSCGRTKNCREYLRQKNGRKKTTSIG